MATQASPSLAVHEGRLISNLIGLVEDVQAQPPLPRFDAEFVERRLKAHRDHQEKQLRGLCELVIDEVLDLPCRVRTTRSLDFEAKP